MLFLILVGSPKFVISYTCVHQKLCFIKKPNTLLKGQWPGTPKRPLRDAAGEVLLPGQGAREAAAGGDRRGCGLPGNANPLRLLSQARGYRKGPSEDSQPRWDGDRKGHYWPSEARAEKPNWLKNTDFLLIKPDRKTESKRTHVCRDTAIFPQLFFLYRKMSAVCLKAWANTYLFFSFSTTWLLFHFYQTVNSRCVLDPFSALVNFPILSGNTMPVNWGNNRDYTLILLPDLLHHVKLYHRKNKAIHPCKACGYSSGTAVSRGGNSTGAGTAQTQQRDTLCPKELLNSTEERAGFRWEGKNVRTIVRISKSAANAFHTACPQN